MADHYNFYPLKHFAATIAECMELELPDTYAPDHGQHLTDGGRGSHGSKLIEDMNVLHFYGTI